MGITMACNFNCIMCSYHLAESQRRSDMHMDDKIFALLDPLWPQATNVEFGGNGEPFMDPSFPKKLLHIKTKNPNIKIKVFTNGSFLSNEQIMLKTLPYIDYLNISINGIHTYEKIMPGGSFESLEKTLRQLHAYRQTHAMPSSMNWGFIVMRDNLHEIATVFKYAATYGFNRIVFKTLWVHNDFLKTQTIQNDPNLISQLVAQVQDLQKQYPRISVKNEYERHVSAPAAPAKPKTTETNTKPRCTSPWDQVQITYNGTVLLCCNAYTYIGNLNQSSFQEVWNSTEAEKYRSGILDGTGCQNCKLINPLQEKSYEKYGTDTKSIIKQ